MLLDAKRAAAGRDRVEHLGQDQAVDDVAGDFDLFQVVACGRNRPRFVVGWPCFWTPRAKVGDRSQDRVIVYDRPLLRLSAGSEKPYTAGAAGGLARPMGGPTCESIKSHSRNRNIDYGQSGKVVEMGRARPARWAQNRRRNQWPLPSQLHRQANAPSRVANRPNHRCVRKRTPRAGTPWPKTSASKSAAATCSA